MISDCGTITWYEPPPVVTETDNSVPSVADSKELLSGVDGSLSWNFTLTGEQFVAAGLKWKTTTVANIRPSLGVIAVVPGFEDRFHVTWSNSQRATLVIFNVTTEHEGDFSCETTSLVGGNLKVWARKIQVAVVGKLTNTERITFVNKVSGRLIQVPFFTYRQYILSYTNHLLLSTLLLIRRSSFQIPVYELQPKVSYLSSQLIINFNTNMTISV